MITSYVSSVIDKLVADLGFAFPVKDLGKLSYLLGLEVDYFPFG